MKKNIKINNYKSIGENMPVFVIAEVGVNHNGKLDMALKMVDEAKKAGADAVKFQTFKTDEVITKNAKKESYMQTKDKDQFQMIKRLELSYADFKKISSYCVRKKIIFLSTPSEEKSVDFLSEAGVGAYKVGSGELNHLPLLSYMAKKGLPMIVSTGASYLKEISEAVSVIKKRGNNKIVLLHCTSYYPAPYDQINLRAIQTLKKHFNVLVGYSDHTLGFGVTLGAVALGARVIERHFTLNKKLEGPDHRASLEPAELNRLIIEIRNLEKAFGSGIKKPEKIEKEERELGRRSVVAHQKISKGDIIKRDMLAIKRPGYGLAPKYVNKLLGKIAKKEISKDTLLSLRDVK